MTADWRRDEARREEAALVDATVPNAARVADYLDGGKDNFEADRKAARSLVAAAPIIGLIAPAWRAFHQRAVRYLVREAGVRQFIYVGVSLAASNDTNEIVWSADPRCRIVFADNDPLVLAHARALMRPVPDRGAGSPHGATGYVDADVSEPGAIVAGARETLDFGQPVAVMLMFILAFIEDTATAAGIVSSLAGALPPGSHVVIHHIASELNPALEMAARRWNQMSEQQITLRSKDEVASLVAGLELVSPGLVPIGEWRHGRHDPHFEEVIPMHAVVARKPIAQRGPR
ncbi:SAM-dependent methyltransferase [Trebonia sp.]|uniref:SAM-dependent methyltransferase n=1 Tax=Trebonia sp. TaxID=2767075 RepID=UPI0026105EE4|nr:SAM-dependent methyltransferase [Trebonia sp.]